jgi:DNA-binding response OmpR family regulator
MWEVLLIEDEEMAGSLPRQVFERLGCRVNTSRVPMVGDYYPEQKQSYDLIVLNIGCPSLQADELISKIHARTPQAQTLYSRAAETFEQDLRKKLQVLPPKR